MAANNNEQIPDSEEQDDAVIGTAFRWSLIIFGIVLNVVAGLGALGFGFVDDRLGGKNTLLITLVGLIAATAIAVWLWGVAPEMTPSSRPSCSSSMRRKSLYRLACGCFSWALAARLSCTSHNATTFSLLEIRKGGPADKAGLRHSDLVIGVDGTFKVYLGGAATGPAGI